MDTIIEPAVEFGALRSSISILTRGGPFTVNVLQDTNPVLLKGMVLPAEAGYIFKNPVDHDHNYVNNPVSVELFFGENGHEGEDISLGVYPIFDRKPTYTSGPKVFEIILSVTTTQILNLSLRDESSGKYFTIAIMDISRLAPPQHLNKPKKPFLGFTKEELQVQVDELMKTPPRQTRLPQTGKDLSQELTISFSEAFHGVEKNLQVPSTLPCPVCTGSGVIPGKTMVYCRTCGGAGITKEVQQTEKGPEYRFSTCPDCLGNGLINHFPCQKCKGFGWIRASRFVNLHIPECIDNGTEICLIHQGEPGQGGGQNGHLRIKINVTAHNLFSRIGRILFIILPVRVDFAKQGGRVRVPSFEKGNSYLVNLPPGTKDNSIIKIFDRDDYSLIARVETYRPAFLFASPQIKNHIQEIRNRLGGVDIEVLGRDSRENKLGKDVISSNEQKTENEHSTKLAEFYIRRGKLYDDKNDKFHALADFNKALELDPTCARAFDSRAAIFGLHKDFTNAKSDIEKAIKLDPRNASYLTHMGMILEYQEDLEGARVAYDKALELDPTCLEAYERRGQLEVENGDLQAAISDFSRALELQPDNDEIRGNRALVYMSLKEFNKSIADLDDFVEKNPKNANGYNNRGFVYLQQNNLEKALCDYDRALELNPGLVSALIYRGKSLLLQCKFLQAIEDLEKAIALSPKDSYPLLLLGQAYQGQGERKKAIAAYQRFIDSSQSPELCNEASRHLGELEA